MTVLSILKKDLLILLRNRIDMAVLFLMPLAFILPISFALGSGDGYGINRENRLIVLTVVNYDGGARANIFLGAIGESLKLENNLSKDLLENLDLTQDVNCADYYNVLSAAPAGEAPVTPPACVERAGRDMLDRSWRSVLLVIPPGFTSAVDSGQLAEVTLLYDPYADPVRLTQVEDIIRGAVVRVGLQKRISQGLNQLVELSAFTPEEVRAGIQEQVENPAPAGSQPALRLEKVYPSSFTRARTPDTYQQTIPGYTVMYVFFIITSLTGSLRQERVSGTFRRLLTAPVGRASLLMGKLLATMLIGIIQVLVLFLVGALVFQLDLGSDPLAFLILTAALVAAATTIGLAAATTSLRGAALGAPLVIAALLGGSMFPIELMPPFLRSLSVFVPHSWALRGYQNLIVRGLGFEEIFPQIMMLLLFAGLFFLVAVMRFDFEQMESQS